MKRAEVFFSPSLGWEVFIWDGEIPDRGECIPLRDDWGREPVSTGNHPTHTAALAHALAEVGLSPTNPEPTEAP